jgi:hypothetical protein
VPARDFGPEAIRAKLADLEWVSACALGHERVTGAVAACRAVAPMRLFAVFRDEASLLAGLRRAAKRLDRTLQAVRGRLECGVRIGVAAQAGRPAPRPRTGTAFLAARAERLQHPRSATPAQAREAAALMRELAVLADRTRVRRVPRDSPIAKAAEFLVTRRNLRRFGAEVARGRRSLRPLGLEVALLGPYPAYSFV